MAITHDYVMQLIEMMGAFFRRLADMIDEQEQARALDALCRDQCGLSMDAACSLSLDTVENLLPPQGIFILSELTWAQAKAMARNGEEREALLLRSLRLLSSLCGEEPMCLARCPRLRDLMDECEPYLTAEDYLRCARFFMAGEHFDDGEDAVFLAVESADAPEDFIPQGLGLFQGLLALPDSTLIPGGLPREDVLRAMDDLKAWGTA